MNIIFAQPNYPVGPKHLKNYYLPYSVGCLWAYCKQFDEIRHNCNVIDWIYSRESISLICDRHAVVDVLFCSVYIWNENYCRRLSQEVKDRWPGCKVIWGGPQVDHDNPDVIASKPYVDIVCVSEGEITTKEILESFLNNKSHSSIPGTVANSNLKPIVNPIRARTDISQFPSPYISGVFDDLVGNNSEVSWSATLETNRGCPYGCTYCDWGSLTSSKIKKFAMDKVKAEIDWVCENNVTWLTVADANFGIFQERDYEIAKYLTEANAKHDRLDGVTITTLKNSNDSIIDISKILGTLNANGVSLPLQSFNADTLKAVKRTNMEINNHKQLIQKIKKENLDYYVEMILPLPCETLDSWKSGYWHMYENGIHDSVSVHLLVLSVNSPMNKFQAEKYRLKTFDLPMEQDEPGLLETQPTVIQTDSMNFDDFVECLHFGHKQTLLHGVGFSKRASMICKEHNIAYYIFYDQLDETLNLSKAWTRFEQECRSQIKHMFQKDNSINDKDIEKFYLFNGMKLRRIIFDAVLKTLEHFEIKNSKQITNESEASVFDVDNKSNWPSTIGDKVYTYTGPEVADLDQFADLLTYRRRKNMITVETL